MVRKSFVSTVSVAALLAGMALGASLPSHVSATHEMPGMAGGGHDESEEHEALEARLADTSAFGEPGNPAKADRTIAISAEEMSYSTDRLDIAVGETVTFTLTNTGRKPHELTIGDAAYQALSHDMMEVMAKAGTSEHSPEHAAMHAQAGNTIVVQPGETKSLTWRFTRPGRFLYQCNFKGHAEGGMTGTIVVSGAAEAAPMPGMDHGDNDMAMPGMDHADHGMAALPGMAMDHDMPMDHSMHGALGGYGMTREASGTAWQPDASKHRGIMTMSGDWTVMVHAMLNGVYDTQSGPRGDDKAFVSGMVMGMAQRSFSGGDVLQFRAMLSPDPFMGRNGYPLLLATGETADGATPLVDRQHPHDLFMELSASYSHPIGRDTSLFVYGGLPGEPAFGPPAFMHRMSIMDSPEAPITHHWLDSTHITFGVVTLGVVSGDWKLEASRFHGREPDEQRFNIETGQLDSTAVRVSWNPAPEWSLQVSWARQISPEELQPDENQTKWSASAIYTRPLGEEGWVSLTAAYGWRRQEGEGYSAAAFEAAWHPDDRWTVFGRAEWTENPELLGDHGPAFDVGKASLGVIRDVRLDDHVKIGVGGLYAVNFVPSGLEPDYGYNPDGAMAFVRLKIE